MRLKHTIFSLITIIILMMTMLFGLVSAGFQIFDPVCNDSTKENSYFILRSVSVNISLDMAGPESIPITPAKACEGTVTDIYSHQTIIFIIGNIDMDFAGDDTVTLALTDSNNNVAFILYPISHMGNHVTFILPHYFKATPTEYTLSLDFSIENFTDASAGSGGTYSGMRSPFGQVRLHSRCGYQDLIASEGAAECTSPSNIHIRSDLECMNWVEPGTQRCKPVQSGLGFEKITRRLQPTIQQTIDDVFVEMICHESYEQLSFAWKFSGDDVWNHLSLSPCQSGKNSLSFFGPGNKSDWIILRVGSDSTEYIETMFFYRQTSHIDGSSLYEAVTIRPLTDPITKTQFYYPDVEALDVDNFKYTSLTLQFKYTDGDGNNHAETSDTLIQDVRMRWGEGKYLLRYAFRTLKPIVNNSNPLTQITVRLAGQWGPTFTAQVVDLPISDQPFATCPWGLETLGNENITMGSKTLRFKLTGLTPSDDLTRFINARTFDISNTFHKTLFYLKNKITIEKDPNGEEYYVINSTTQSLPLASGHTVLTFGLPYIIQGGKAWSCNAIYTDIKPACPLFVPHLSIDRTSPTSPISMFVFHIPPIGETPLSEHIQINKISAIPYKISPNLLFSNCKWTTFPSVYSPTENINQYPTAALYPYPNHQKLISLPSGHCDSDGKHDFNVEYTATVEGLATNCALNVISLFGTNFKISYIETDSRGIYITIPRLPWDSDLQARTVVESVEIFRTTTDEPIELCHTPNAPNTNDAEKFVLAASSPNAIASGDYFTRVKFYSESNDEGFEKAETLETTMALSIEIAGGNGSLTFGPGDGSFFQTLSGTHLYAVPITLAINDMCTPIYHASYIKSHAKYYQFTLHTSQHTQPIAILDVELVVNYLTGAAGATIGEEITHITSIVPIINTLSNIKKVHLPYIDDMFLPNDRLCTIEATLMRNDGKRVPAFTYTSPQFEYPRWCSSCTNGTCFNGKCIHDEDSTHEKQCQKLQCPSLFTKSIDCTHCECLTLECRNLSRTAQIKLTTESQYTEEYNKTAHTLFTTHVAKSLQNMLLLHPIPLRSNSPDYNTIIPQSTFPDTVEFLQNGKPIASEEIAVHFMNPTQAVPSYNNLLITITMKFTTDYPPLEHLTYIDERFALLQRRLQYIINNNLFKTDENYPFYTGMVFTLPPQQKIQFIKYNRPSTSSSLTLFNHQMKTLCRSATALPTALPTQCPLPTSFMANNSPYWSKCDEKTKQRRLTPVCTDLYGKEYISGSNDASWCTHGYYGYPNVITTTIGCDNGTVGSKDVLINQILPITSTTLQEAINNNNNDVISLEIESGSKHMIAFTYPITTAPNDYTIDVLFRSTPRSYSQILSTVSVTSGQVAITIPSDLISEHATISLRCTQFVSYQSKLINIKIIQSTTEENDKCISECPYRSQCVQGECVCNSGYTLTELPNENDGDESENNSNTAIRYYCMSNCERCTQDMTCNGQDKTICPTCPFTPTGDGQPDEQSPNTFHDDWCTYHNGCTVNTTPCQNNGYRTFDINTQDKCSEECYCIGGWGGVHCEKCQLNNDESENNDKKCNDVGTDMTKSLLLCDKCHCYPGFTGDNCEIATVFGHVSFIYDVDNVDNNVIVQKQQKQQQIFHKTTNENTGETQLTLTNEGRTVLLRDFANSIGLAVPNSVDIIYITVDGNVVDFNQNNVFNNNFDGNNNNIHKLNQNQQQYSSVLSSYSQQITTTQVKTTANNTISFSINPSSASVNDLDALLNGWDNMNSSFGDLPIVATDAQVEVGKPTSSSAPKVATAETLCSEFKINCPPEPPVDDKKTNLGLILGVVFGIIGVVVLFIVFLVLLSYCKKNEKCCFTPQKKKSKSKQSSGSSSPNGSTAGTSEMTMTSAGGDNSTMMTTTGTSASSNSAIDLVQVVDQESSKLPFGWTKMQHTTTGQILYINQAEMKSQKNSPLSEEDSGNGW